MADLDEARIEVVRRHMALEITHDWDGVLATFDHPRYELMGPGTIFDGEAAVRSYFATSREPFPDQANEVIAIAADADDEYGARRILADRARISDRSSLVCARSNRPARRSGSAWPQASNSRPAATRSSASVPITTSRR